MILVNYSREFSIIMWSLLYISLLTFLQDIKAETTRPIIGIVAEEISVSLNRSFPHHSSYIAASYVKSVESSAAQVVPIAVNKSESYYRNILRSINGIVLPGGATTLGHGHPYYDTVSIIYRIAKEINDENIRFPILAICLGFEFILTISNKDVEFLKRCEAENEILSLKFVQPYAETRFFSNLNVKQYNLLTSQNLTVNWHSWCAFVNDFNKQEFLRDNWIITTLSTSFKNQEFIASVEHKRYPFFGIQFHPEKVSFEWNKRNNYIHSSESVEANRYFFDQLVYFARQNNQNFSDPNIESESLIYNYPVTYTGIKGSFFTQVYFDPDGVSRSPSNRSSFIGFKVFLFVVLLTLFWH